MIKELITALQQAVDCSESNANKQEVFDAGFKAGLQCAVDYINDLNDQTVSVDVEINQTEGDLELSGTLSEVDVQVSPDQVIDGDNILELTSDEQWLKYTQVDAK